MWNLLFFAVFFATLATPWKIFALCVEIQFFSKILYRFSTKWSQWTNRLLFYMSAYFASLFSFYPTFYGLRKFRWGIFDLFVLNFSIFSKVQCTNLSRRVQSKQQIMGSLLFKRLSPKFAKKLWLKTGPFFDILVFWKLLKKTALPIRRSRA